MPPEKILEASEPNGIGKGWDPSQIAGTPEWKARVQAECSAGFQREIHGAAALAPEIIEKREKEAQRPT